MSRIRDFLGKIRFNLLDTITTVADDDEFLVYDKTDNTFKKATKANATTDTAAAAPATGSIDVVTTGVWETDGSETIRIQDGAGGDVTFTVINNAGAGSSRVDANNCNLDLGGGATFSRADFGRAVNAAIAIMRDAGDLAIDSYQNNFGVFDTTYYGDKVILTNQANGTDGNIAIVLTNLDATQITVTGMSGGVDA